MALSSLGTSARRWEYQVFLSFRGPDTRSGFVSHLYDKLHNGRGIRTFKDDRDLERGTTISPELLRAIEQSHFAIIVLSADYASSSWCLDELTKIVQSMEAGKILPVFYKVEPTIVRQQTGSFAQAFMEHGTKFSPEKVEEWRAALKTVANISGWHVDGNKLESDLIDDVVNCVWEQVRHTFKLLHKFVGRDFALHQLMGLLALGENDVRFIGITGMGGIGKTTLARIVFDSISRDYDVRCFLANVREVSEREGTVVGLQKKLLSPILKEKVVEVWDDEDGAIFIAKCFWNKKVLLVLDDVDLSKQLQKLAGGKDWFGSGSRIIMTTRNHRLLEERDISLSYKVEEMRYGEALALFSLNAFKKDQPHEEFLELSKRFVKYAEGVPLVLHILGSSLYKRDRDAWTSVLDNLQNNPDPKVFDVLKISYDGLQAMEKRIFLDIACFHKGKHQQQVIGILDRRFSNISSLIVIDSLIEKSLLTMSNHKYLEMHDVIQDMGREIVLRESEDEPGKRTRIWRFDDLHHVLTFTTGTEAIEVIIVNSPKSEEIRCDSNGFSNMRGLKHIELYNVKIIFSAPIWLQHFLRIIHWRLYPWDPICLPPSLRIISWDFFSLEFLPRSFLTRNLTELRMPQSKLVRLCDGRMDFPNLKILDLGGSEKLTSTPNFTGMPNLENLRFDWCPNLVDIHSSIAVLKRLKVLNFYGCKRIKSLPSKLEMDSLEELNLGGCSKLKKVPEFSKQMKNLSTLNISSTAIEELPSSIGNLIRLSNLNLWWTAIEQLPSSIGNLVGLRKLNLSWCKRLCVAGWPLNQHLNRFRCLQELDLSDCNLGEGAIPEDIGCLSSLIELDLGGNHFVTLPASIQRLSNLEDLVLGRCESLRELPPLPPQGCSFEYLNVDVKNCTSLQRLTDPSKLSSKFANLYDFYLAPWNCVRLVEDEGFINYVRSRMVRWITKDWLFKGEFTYPASEIPEWFVNKSEEAEDWLGIAFCFVWASEIPHGFMSVRIEWSSGLFDPLEVKLEGHLGPEHVTMFYLSREKCRKECPEAAEAEFSVKEIYFDVASQSMKVGGVNMVKKWAARWVYKQDLVDLQQRLKITKRTHEYYGEEADSSGSDAISDDEESDAISDDEESDAISDDEEPNRERLKVLKRPHEYYGEEAGPSGSAAISDDEEPNRKRQKEDRAALDIESE